MISCSTSRYIASTDSDYESYRVHQIFETHYPELLEYYDNDLIKVNSIKEIRSEDGSVDYKLNYHFVKHYYYDYDIISLVRDNMTDLYRMYTNGIIDLVSAYKYVDKNDGRIKYHITYRHIGYDRIYNYYYPRYLSPYRYDYYYYRPSQRIIVPSNPPRSNNPPTVNRSRSTTEGNRSSGSASGSRSGTTGSSRRR